VRGVDIVDATHSKSTSSFLSPLLFVFVFLFPLLPGRPLTHFFADADAAEHDLPNTMCDVPEPAVNACVRRSVPRIHVPEGAKFHRCRHARRPGRGMVLFIAFISVAALFSHPVI
jgi:hypothetical protein